MSLSCSVYVLHSKRLIPFTRIGSNEFMGCVTLGPKFGGQSRDHWYEMLETPRRPVAYWYSLLERQPLHHPSGGKCCISHRMSTDSSSDILTTESNNGHHVPFQPVPTLPTSSSSSSGSSPGNSNTAHHETAAAEEHINHATESEAVTDVNRGLSTNGSNNMTRNPRLVKQSSVTKSNITSIMEVSTDG